MDVFEGDGSVTLPMTVSKISPHSSEHWSFSCATSPSDCILETAIGSAVSGWDKKKGVMWVA
jgi:hypothetical protein